MSCKKDKDKEPEESAPVVTPATPLSSSTAGYLKFTIANVDYSFQASAGNLWFSGVNNVTTQSSSKYYTQSNTYNSSSKTGIFILTKRDTTSQSPKVNDTYFKNFLKTQTYSISSLPATSNDPRGIYISVKDNSNVMWYSINPVTSKGFQSGSFFKVVEKVEFMEVAPNLTIKFKANFNCKLYNAAGDSLMLTNGEIITSYSNT